MLLVLPPIVHGSVKIGPLIHWLHLIATQTQSNKDLLFLHSEFPREIKAGARFGKADDTVREKCAHMHPRNLCIIR